MTTSVAEVQNWYTASKNLTRAIQEYFDASLVLEDTITHQYESFLKWSASTRDKLFGAIVAEQGVVESRTKKLERAKSSINKLYNCSSKLVPIRSLPDEILARVFALTCDNCTFFSLELLSNDARQCYKPLLLVTKVCSDWRRIAMNTASLWSHLDITHDVHGKRPRIADLWLERARSAPLSAQIFFERGSVHEDNTSALGWLLPHLGSIFSLGLQCRHSSDWLHTAVQLWLENGTPGSVKEISIYGSRSTTGNGQIRCLDDVEGIDPSRVDSVLTPVRTLRLRHVLFEWASTAYHGLVHLELSYTPNELSPTLRQLANILSASPNLRTLTLHAVTIRSQPNDDVFLPPVRLRALETLNVWGLRVNPYSTLFPILQQESSQFNVGIHSSWPIQPIFEQFDVTRLLFYITMSTGRAPAVMHIPPFPKLGALVVTIGFGVDQHTCSTILENLISLSRSESNGTRRWPKLHTLWFFGGLFSIKAMKEVVEAHNIRTLILTNIKHHSGDPVRLLRPCVEELLIEQRVSELNLPEWPSRLR